MQARAVLLLVLAVGAGLGTVQFARQWLSAQQAGRTEVRPPAEAPRRVARVLVAAADLSAGRFIAAEDLRWQSWPDEALAEGYVAEGAGTVEGFVGAVVRRPVAAGEPVTAGKVVRPGERGFLAAVLNPGMRAVSVPVNETTGIAGLIFPGDRVDLILSHSLHPDDPSGGTQRRAGETVLTDIRVLAIGQNLEVEAGEPKLGHTATLEVTPRQAEKIAVMLELGTIGLSLRSLALAEAQPDAAALPEPRLADAVTPGAAAMLAAAVAAASPGAVPAGRVGRPAAAREPHQTYTLDTDVSLLLARRPAAAAALPARPQVVVVRGNSIRGGGAAARGAGAGPSAGAGGAAGGAVQGSPSPGGGQS